MTNPPEGLSRAGVEPPTPADLQLAAKPSTIRNIFFGPDGLRAGWSLLIFIAMFAAIGYSVNIAVHKLHLPTPDSAAAAPISPLAALLVEGLNVVVVLFITWIMSKMERRPIAVYGFEDKRKLTHFLAGMGWGIVSLSVLVLSLLRAGLLVIDGRVLFGGDILRYGAVWLLGFLLVGVFEESITRGTSNTRSLAVSPVCIGGFFIPGIAQPWASGPQPCSFLLFLVWVIAATRANRPSDCSPRAWAAWCFALACGVPARCGGQSAFTLPGTGASLSSME